LNFVVSPFFHPFFHSELTISFHKVKVNAYLKQLYCCRNNEAVRKQLKTNFPYFGVKVMKGAETDRPLSVRDSAKAIPRSLPIIFITHVTPNAMAAQNVAEECSFV
jgi:hypothetical protein